MISAPGLLFDSHNTPFPYEWISNGKRKEKKKLGEKKTYFSVGSSVLQQTLDKLDRLGWPSSLGDTKFLTLSGSTNGRVKSSEWNGSLVVQDLIQVLLSLF